MTELPKMPKINPKIPKMMPDLTIFEIAAMVAKHLSFSADKTALFVAFMALRSPREHDLTYVLQWGHRFETLRPTSDMDELSLNLYKSLVRLQADVAVGKVPIHPSEEQFSAALKDAEFENMKERDNFIQKLGGYLTGDHHRITS